MRYVVAALMILMSSAAYAGNVTLNWVFDASATATCADGSPAAQNCPATGFEIQELDSNNIWSVREGVAATTRTRTYTNVAAGATRCYRIRTNSNGTFSEPSSQACVTVPSVAPKAPSVTVVVSVSLPTP